MLISSSKYGRHKQVGQTARSASTATNVVSRLEDVYSRYLLLSLHGHKEAPAPATNVGFFTRAFLLFKPTSVKGWLFHSLFYYFAFSLILSTAVSISIVLDEGWSEILFYDISLFVFGFLTAFFFSFLANRDRLRNIEKSLVAAEQDSQ